MAGYDIRKCVVDGCDGYVVTLNELAHLHLQRDECIELWKALTNTLAGSIPDQKGSHPKDQVKSGLCKYLTKILRFIRNTIIYGWESVNTKP